MKLTEWYRQSADEVVAELATDLDAGLNTSEVEERRAHFGKNELPEKGGESIFSKLKDQFLNPLVLLLAGAAVVSVFNGDAKSAISITAIVVLNAALGIVQDLRAEAQMNALKKLAAPNARVIRNGQTVVIPASELVPGDVLVLEAGDIIPADARLIVERNFEVHEASLTGESVAVAKRTEKLKGENLNPGDQVNMVFMGTYVTSGRGTAVVTSIGSATQIGTIAEAIDEVEEEQTPLQIRMEELAKGLVYGSLAAVVAVVGFGVLAGGDWRELALIASSMAVAIVPEALPAVLTITLAIGAQRMVNVNALPRGLSPVGTFGAVNIICSDKTGTLTENRMVVKAIFTGTESYDVTGAGYQPEGEVLRRVNGGSEPVAELNPDLQLLLLTGVLANNTAINTENGGWEVIGDPTENAILLAGIKGQLDIDDLRMRMLRLDEAPFESERARHSVVVRNNAVIAGAAESVLFTKGAPETVIELCHYAYVNGEIVPIETVYGDAMWQNDALAEKGMRVLGFAFRLLAHEPAVGEAEQLEEEMVWLGMMAMIDAPRPKAREAVQRARRGGIRTIMITGDHPKTALEIARQLTIAHPGFDDVVTGAELNDMTDAELIAALETTNVFARVSPLQKLRLVQVLQSLENCVAMTGDGVNDAPALRQAHVGIAMGSGTQVAQDAANIVLTDDDFVSIVKAVEQGRIIFTNVKKYLKYLLGSNVGEFLALAAAPLVGIPLPLIPVQILWMNLVTDGLPAVLLGIDPEEGDVMGQQPFRLKESIFARGMGAYIMRIGVVFGIITLAFMWFARQIAPDYVVNGETIRGAWATMTFSMLCLSQMGHAFTCRGERASIFTLGFRSNKWLFRAIIATSILQVLMLFVPPVAGFFGLVPLTLGQLAIVFAVSTLLFVYVEIEKVFLRRRDRRQA